MRKCRTRWFCSGNRKEHIKLCAKRDAFLFDVTLSLSIAECHCQHLPISLDQRSRRGSHQFIDDGDRCSILLVCEAEDDWQNRWERRQHGKIGFYCHPNISVKLQWVHACVSTLISLACFRVTKCRLLSSNGDADSNLGLIQTAQTCKIRMLQLKVSGKSSLHRHLLFRLKARPGSTSGHV